MTDGKRIVIVGGGHNGLVCAAYLAAVGLSVCVLERRGIVGGAAVTEEFHPGFRNSTLAYTVFRGWNSAARRVTRSSGTRATPTLRRPRPGDWATPASAPVRRLNSVVLPLPGNPMMPSLTTTECTLPWVHGALDPHPS